MPVQPRFIFITGSDTGVGKTLLTALLLARLRAHAVDARALKPFCTGDLSDATLLGSVHGTPADEVCRWFWPQPLTPLLAARLAGEQVALTEAVAWLRSRAADSGVTLIEGAGGLLSPLGVQFCARELIRELDCATIAVVPNKLGAINQARLLWEALAENGGVSAFVLMGIAAGDELVERTNVELIQETTGCAVHTVPYLGCGPTISEENSRFTEPLIKVCIPEERAA